MACCRYVRLGVQSGLSHWKIVIDHSALSIIFSAST